MADEYYDIGKELAKKKVLAILPPNMELREIYTLLNYSLVTEMVEIGYIVM